MAEITIIQGENFILRRNLELADGSPLDVSTLIEAVVELSQNNKVVKTYTYPLVAPSPTDELRVGLVANQLELEITEAISNTLNAGLCRLSWKMKRPNSLYKTDTFQRDIINEDNLVIVIK